MEEQRGTPHPDYGEAGSLNQEQNTAEHLGGAENMTVWRRLTTMHPVGYRTHEAAHHSGYRTGEAMHPAGYRTREAVHLQDTEQVRLCTFRIQNR